MPKHEIQAQRDAAENSKLRFQALYRNDSEAANVLLKKAENNVDAMYDASRMYRLGRGLKQDMIESAFWHGLAERINEEKRKYGAVIPQSNRPDFQLTEEQESAVQKRIAEWRAHPPVQEKKSVLQGIKKALRPRQ